MATAQVHVAQAVPSHMRSVPGSVNIPVAQFPSAPTAKLSEAPTPAEVALQLVGKLNKALEAKDYSAIANLFIYNGYWRDHLALSWRFRTSKSPTDILSFLQACAESKDGFRLKSIDIDATTTVRSPKVVSIDAAGSVSGIQSFVTVETVLGTGVGLMRLVENELGEWKIFTLYTRVDKLNGHEEATRHRRPKGAEHGGKPGRQNWADKREAEVDLSTGKEPAVLVIGKLPYILNSVLIHLLITVSGTRRWPSWPYCCGKAQDARR